ncbi:MAG TPA: sulfatase [Candidatus Acidoferrum sp.]|nr:sulfatase [Candidatus Acidoferrum sp.]
MVRCLLSGVLLLFAASPPAQAARPARKPNILFILVDDYGIKDVGIEGSTFYETPHIDALARSGMRFTQGYATCQVCSPSRASILLGKYPARHGITDYIGAEVGASFARQRHTQLLVPDYVRNLPAADTNLAQALKAGGYVTFFAGKWHLGSKGAWLEDRGFDINKGGWDAGTPKGGYYAPWENPKLPSGPRGQSLTLRLADETVAFIEQHKDQPFLAYLAFYAVHGPIQTTKPLWQKYRDKAAQGVAPAERFKLDGRLPVRVVQDNPIYAGLIEEMDTAVGRVLKCLEELGLADNTIVVFTSDNGGVVSGDAYSSSQLPYRGGKGRQWEGGLRVPLYIRAPGVTKPGSTCDTPVIGTDFYPTLLQLAGLPSPPQQHVDGVSLVPLLKGGQIAPRPLFWHYPHYGNQGGAPSSIIRKGAWKLIHYWEDSHNELYNLAADTGEQHDVAAQEVERTGLLWAELQAWLRETGARLPQPNPEYQPAWAAEQRQEAVALKAELEKKHAQFLEPHWQPNPTWWKSLVTPD